MGREYRLISADGHAGAQMHEYRPYLEERYRSDFDEWAKSFVNPWTDLRGETAYRNWDSTLRLRELEAGGVRSAFIEAVTDKPGRRRPKSACPDFNRIFTGTRWTTFVKLPVALSGGSKAN